MGSAADASVEAPAANGGSVRSASVTSAPPASGAAVKRRRIAGAGTVALLVMPSRAVTVSPRRGEGLEKEMYVLPASSSDTAQLGRCPASARTASAVA